MRFLLLDFLGNNDEEKSHFVYQALLEDGGNHPTMYVIFRIRVY